LRRRAVEVIHDRQTAAALGRADGADRDALPADVDLAVVVGGDGTLLSVARSAAPNGIPVLGINLGTMGFLTELQPEEAHRGFEAILEGRYTIEERQTLRVRHHRSGGAVAEYALLNDAVVAKSALARMITIAVRIDSEPVATYTADGLILSTSTGSTAYNLSAGGPILDPRMNAFVITPICPHTMTYRPLVIPGTVRIEVEVPDAKEVYLTLDGQIGFPFSAQDRLAVDAHPRPVGLVRVAGAGFFEVLRKKLRWGER
jgi:NAD+ kinase